MPSIDIDMTDEKRHIVIDGCYRKKVRQVKGFAVLVPGDKLRLRVEKDHSPESQWNAMQEAIDNNKE